MNETRSFLSTAIASGLDFEVMSPEDVIQHITMDVLAHHLPVELKTRLLTAALEADTMNAMVVLDTLGVDALAEHVPPNLLWDCVSSAAGRSLGTPAGAKAGAKAAETKAPVTQPGEPLPDAPISPAVNAAPRAATRKPNRAAVASRVGAGATSRPAQTAASLQAQAPAMEDEDSAFDVDTRVGHDPSLDDLDVIEETAFGDPSDEVTSHGHKP